ncbi:MAG: CPBP family intramembrane metalloprotease [Proteobacteria bacterium]|nr:CPBP family intramembrane metalloprotease [Pseudomonadota bacterium]
MTLLDHSFVFIFAIVFPIAGFLGFRRLLRRADAGESVNRSQLYRNTSIGHWTLFLMCMALWAGEARPWTALGFAMQLDLRFALAAILTVLGIAVLLMQSRQVKAATQEQINGIKERFGRLSIIMPRNGNELARFYGLSITAGIVEEILWRGFLIWYLGQFMPLWAAALVSTLGFAMAHAYQGLSHLPQITAVGAAFAGLYLLAGSIWLPIILHAAVDILQGRLAYDVIRGQAASASSHR